jgi:putative proteasome-type protease
MTYCVGILVESGLVMIADTRTNAGVDHVSTYRKLQSIVIPGERCLLFSTSGNLSISQAAVTLAKQGLKNPETEKIDTLENVPTLFEAAHLIGRAIRKVHERHGEDLEESGLAFEVSFLIGGQIKGDDMHLYLVYSAGNWIECGSEAPFLQIGEHKYGKPILDRSIQMTNDLSDVVKIGLISMDATLRSNLGVGMPIDLAVLRKDTFALSVEQRIDENDVYFKDLRKRWSTALRAAHLAISKPPYEG